ncbi:MAG: alpha/beta hydrolase [Proteobacteria bacterium]|nr:MAG: alpha/beta hydrolase [Pseudomonadota bacterium]
MASPELQTVIQLLKDLNFGAPGDIASMRRNLEIAASLFQKPADVAYEPVDADGVPAEWTSAPDADATRALVYFHGGAYTSGGIGSHRALCTELSRVAGVRVLNVGYRLAPEDPHPAAVEDALSVTRWLAKQGVAPERTAFGGDSAGGGLALAALVALRDAGEDLPAAAVCLSPWTDLTLSGASFRGLAHVDPMVRPESLTLSRDRYVDAARAASPLASPLFADFTGLPPLLLQVGSAECLLDDSTRVAARAQAAGVDVTLEVWDEMIHVWQAFFPLLPEARDALAQVAAFLRGRLA